MKILNFTDLIAWQKGHAVVLNVYKLTAKFPPTELFSLVDQVRRSAMSITNNIAEGFSRKSPKEKSQFFHLSLGSKTELQNQVIISRDLGYISQEEYGSMFAGLVEVHKLLFGLIKSLKTNI